MPFPRLTKSKHVPEKDDRPLLYAQQPSSTPSLAPSAATTTTTAKSQPYRDPEQLSTSDDTQTAEESPKVEPEDSTFTRPTTPPQGSNYNPWSSYRDLPPDHPVFRYPDEVREKMYAKGVGKYRQGNFSFHIPRSRPVSRSLFLAALTDCQPTPQTLSSKPKWTSRV